MDQHVRFDVTGLLETFAAHLAVILTLLRVREYMPLQHALRREYLLAVVAFEQTIDVADLGRCRHRRRRCCRVTFVRMRVLLQRVQRVELYAAHRALERTVIVMRQRVLAKVTQLLETLVAHVAYVRPFVRMRSHVPLQHAGKAELLLAICTL